MMFTNATEVQKHLWKELSLDTHSITFSVVDMWDDGVFFTPGLIESKEALRDSDVFAELCEKFYAEKYIEVYSVASYVIGEGESDHADESDCDLLKAIHDDSPAALDDFLRSGADCLASLSDVELENPDYEEDDDEEDDEDE